MAQQGKAPAPRAVRQRILRIGIIQGGRIIEERLVRHLRNVSLGQGPRNSFTISSENLPRSYTVFRVSPDGRYTLNFAEGMDGRVSLGGSVRTLTQAREAGMARRAGDWWHLPLDPSARGKLVIGEVTLLFQFVQAPPHVPRARLPATIQGSIGSRMDPTFSAVLAGCLVLAVAFFVTAQVVPKPTGGARSKRFNKVVQAEMQRQAQKPPEPPRDRRDAADVSADGDTGDSATKDPGPRPRPGPKKADSTPKGPIKKDSQAYKDALGELTAASVRDDRMTSVAIAGQCTDPAGCKNVIHGPDALERGHATGSLDQAALLAEKSGGTGSGSGPGSGTGRRKGPVGPTGVHKAGTSVGTDSGGPGGMPPAMIKQIKGKVDVFVPPPMLPPGGAGDALRARIRARVLGLRSCYDQALISNPKLSGTVRIGFVVLPNGRVSNVTVTSGMGGAVVSCIQGRVTSWQLVQVPHQVFIQPFSVRFTPGG